MMLNIKVEDQTIATEAKGAKEDILAETVLAVISAARTFSEITHVPVEDAVVLICSSAKENCDPEHFKGKIISFKIPKKRGKNNESTET